MAVYAGGGGGVLVPKVVSHLKLRKIFPGMRFESSCFYGVNMADPGRYTATAVRRCSPSLLRAALTFKAVGRLRRDLFISKFSFETFN